MKLERLIELVKHLIVQKKKKQLLFKRCTLKIPILPILHLP